jgi:TPR repeat protein
MRFISCFTNKAKHQYENIHSEASSYSSSSAKTSNRNRLTSPIKKTISDTKSKIVNKRALKSRSASNMDNQTNKIVAMQLLEKVMKNDPEANFQLGEIFSQGLYSTEFYENRERYAFASYLKAANAGHAEAQYKVALYYLENKTIFSSQTEQENSEKYFEYLEKSARNGCIQALATFAATFKNENGEENISSIRKIIDTGLQKLSSRDIEGNADIKAYCDLYNISSQA